MGPNVKQLVGLSGIFIGVGEVVGMYNNMKKVRPSILVTQFIPGLWSWSRSWKDFLGGVRVRVGKNVPTPTPTSV
jgi:hypothetical protein